jgi:hypothetical protein
MIGDMAVEEKWEKKRMKVKNKMGGNRREQGLLC